MLDPTFHHAAGETLMIVAEELKQLGEDKAAAWVHNRGLLMCRGYEMVREYAPPAIDFSTPAAPPNLVGWETVNGQALKEGGYW